MAVILKTTILNAFFNKKKVCILPKMSLQFVPNFRIYNIPALVQIMAWHRPGDKPYAKPMTVSLLTHICVTRPQFCVHYISNR